MPFYTVARRRLLRRFIIVLSLPLLLAGCQNNDARTGPTAKSYGNDGHLGMVNSNPLLPGRQPHFDYRAQADFVKQKLQSLNGIESSRITFHGPHLYVTLKPSKDLDDEGVRELGSKAQAMLEYNMPTYRVHVKTAR
ncbi:hypothetical protein IJ21_02040 [Paenibacillus sp. 32O-W]|jgi:hypothetical protein|uniref:Sporulation protein n=1 Tax=Paenibacillus cisolokensis TaxID=1658519 RepID=A0ABQ4N9M3_9BACL|nr:MULTISPECIES: hypothetical protein [Paenibacillus]ALS25648.1 hypothetical protein IJ21_02040 [Paenibacillus sp. 32O-W]GIQ64950.1 hypothetical protein PACILC2_35180 [Paenibacillus cisolokensis]